jgi:deazaflavin-dependent oxidoreductase (nitroreductase family)
VQAIHVARRWLYRGKHPHKVALLLNAAQAQLAARGIGPRRVVVLEVIGRRTGKPIRFPVVVADYHGERYLVSMFGDTANWVRNVRAAGGKAVLRHGSREVVRLLDVPPAERAPILRRYLECAPAPDRTSAWTGERRLISSSASRRSTRCSASPAARHCYSRRGCVIGIG